MLWRIASPSPTAVALVAEGFSHALVATIVIALRVWVRATAHCFGMDDWFMVAGFFASIINNGTTLWGASLGVGSYDSALTPDQIRRAGMTVYGWEVSSMIAVVLIKTSVCTALLRLAPARRVYRIAIWAMIGLSWVLACLSLVLVVVNFYKQPVVSPSRAACADACLHRYALAFTYVVFAVNLLVDAGCVVLPFCFLWKLQMRTRQKISLMILLGLGSLASITLILRQPFTLQYLSDSNRLYYQGRAIVWANIEILVGLVAGSMPALWKLRHVGKEVCCAGGPRTRPKAKPPRPEHNVGLVTIGQIVGMTSRSRLAEDDADDARSTSAADGDEVGTARGRRPSAGAVHTSKSGVESHEEYEGSRPSSELK